MEFLPILIKHNGDVIHNVFATNHKDLIVKYISNEDEQSKNYFKATFSPIEDHRLDDIENYQFIINEVYIPAWFTDFMKLDVIKKLKALISSMIIRNRKQLLLHEGAILVGNSCIDEIKHSIIFGMYDNTKINVVNEASEIHIMTDDACIEEMIDGTKIEFMGGCAKVRTMKDYSKIMKMFGRAKVGNMHDNSRIAMLKGDSNVMEMHDDSKADRLKHQSRVDEMHDHSTIEEMWDWSVVEKMFDYASIRYMDEESKVIEMYGNSMVEEMYGNSVVERLAENSLVRKLNDLAKIWEKEL